MEQVIFGGFYNACDNTDTEENPLVGGYVWDTGTFPARQMVASAGNLKNLRVKLNDSPGGGKHYDFTVLVNGNPSSLTVEIADAETSKADTSNTAAVVAGDLISLQCNPDSTPTARYATWTCMFDSTTANESLICGGTFSESLNKTATEYAAVMTPIDSPTTTEDNHRQVCPTAGIIKNLYVVLSTDPGTDPDAYRFTLRLDGATVGESLIVTITADLTTGNDQVHELDVAAGDVLTMMIEPLNGPSATPTAQWGMTFLADTDGESITMGGTTSNPHTTNTQYIYPCGSIQTWDVTEAQRSQLGQECTIKNLYLLLSAAPDAGKHYDFTIRKAAGASNVTVEIADAATTGNSGGLDDTVADDDYVSLECNPDTTPDATAVYWGFVGYIESIVGWAAGNVNGVPAANIAAVDGIPVANIAKIDGI